MCNFIIKRRQKRGDDDDKEDCAGVMVGNREVAKPRNGFRACSAVGIFRMP